MLRLTTLLLLLLALAFARVASAEDVDLCFKVWVNDLDIVGNRINPDEQKRKLERVVETARQIWG